MQNTVAKILKIYAVVNAFCGFILGLYVRGDSDNPILLGVCIYFIATCIVASFGIYAFGEVVQLRTAQITPLTLLKFTHQLLIRIMTSCRKSKITR